jgi:hypothetical protein
VTLELSRACKKGANAGRLRGKSDAKANAKKNVEGAET